MSPLTSISQELLDLMNDIEEHANRKISELNGNQSSDAFAYENLQASINLRRIHQANIGDYRALSTEPLIVRLTVREEGSQTEQTYIISRFPPLHDYHPNGAYFSGYHAPMGRLAEFEVGDEPRAIRTPAGIRHFEVLAKERTQPRKKDGRRWDGVRNIIILPDETKHSIDSLLEYLASVRGSTTLQVSKDLLAELIAETPDRPKSTHGIRREVVEGMALRDQAILDRHQGDIFREPVDAKILVLGPPGTGKTTTLVKRVAQKLSSVLEPEEQDIFFRLPDPKQQAKRWVLFTPTELLKLYVQQAFNKEGVPTPESSLKTWDAQRIRLGRETLGILRTPTFKSGLVQRSEDHWLKAEDAQSQIDFYESWAKYHDLATGQRIETAVQALLAAEELLSGQVIQRLRQSFKAREWFQELLNLHRYIGDQLGQERTRLRNELSELHRTAVNQQLVRDRGFLSDISTLLDDPEDAEDLDEIETDDDGDLDENEIRRALRAYERAVESSAKAKLNGRSLAPSSRAGRISKWLGDRIPDQPTLHKIGLLAMAVEALALMSRPVDFLFRNLPKTFLKFRLDPGVGLPWYQEKAGFQSKDRRKFVSDSELDAILLLMLRKAREISKHPSGQQLEDRGGVLANIKAERYAQVLVDEATDFSPLQLACMLELSCPEIRGFFACGDLHQRVTKCGINAIDQFQWIDSGIDTKYSLKIRYRQTRKLSSLAAGVAQIDGAVEAAPHLPDWVDIEGFAPVLWEGASHVEPMAWVAERISEIYQAVGKLPSISVFVDGEAMVERVATELGSHVRDVGIQVVPCRDGRAIGNRQDIRVFDIRHIKGLEFEGAFVLGLDEMTRTAPDLVNKFLYLGSTRAATYFGLTCTERLPVHLEALRPHFGHSWTSV